MFDFNDSLDGARIDTLADKNPAIKNLLTENPELRNPFNDILHADELDASEFDVYIDRIPEEGIKVASASGSLIEFLARQALKFAEKRKVLVRPLPPPAIRDTPQSTLKSSTALTPPKELDPAEIDAFIRNQNTLAEQVSKVVPKYGPAESVAEGDTVEEIASSVGMPPPSIGHNSSMFSDEGNDLFQSAIPTKKRSVKQYIASVRETNLSIDRIVYEIFDETHGFKMLEEAGNIEGPGGAPLRFEGNFLKEIMPGVSNPKLKIIGRGGKSPYMNARLLRTIKDIIDHQFQRNTLQWNGAKDELVPTGPGFAISLEALSGKQEVDDFFKYMAALRAQHLYVTRDIVTALTSTAERRRINTDNIARGNANPVFEETRERLAGFNQRQLNFAVRNNLISDESMVALLDKNPDYVPLIQTEINRVTGLPVTRGNSKVTKKISGLSKKQIAQANTGEKIFTVAEIMPALLRNTALFTELGMKNHSMNVTFDFIRNMDPDLAKEWATEITDTKRIRSFQVDVETIQKSLNKAAEEAGVEEIDVINIPEGVVQLLAFDRMSPTDGNVVMELVKGKPVYWEINNPILFGSFQDMGMGSQRFAASDAFMRSSPVRAAQHVKNIYTRLVTANPAFAFIANPSRDIVGSIMQSSDEVRMINPLAGTLKMLMGLIGERNNATAQFFLDGGGLNTMFDGTEESQRKLLIAQKDFSGGILLPNVRYVTNPGNAIKAAWKFYESVISAVEYGPRRQEHDVALSKGASGREAGFLSRNPSTDFNMRGANIFLSMLTSTTPFTRPALTGMYTTYKAAKSDFWKWSAKAGILVSIPAVYLWAKNHNDPTYNDFPDHLKDTHHMVRVGWMDITNKEGQIEQVGEYVAIPKAHEYAVLDNFTRGFLDTIYTKHGPEFTDLLLRNIMMLSPVAIEMPFAGSQGSAPVPVPQILKPFIEHGTGFKMLAGTPIIPEHLQGMEKKHLQNQPWTPQILTDLAKSIAKSTGVEMSPMMLEHYIVGYTGRLGRYSLEFADSMVEFFGEDSDNEQPNPKVLASLYGIFDIKEDDLIAGRFFHGFPLSKTQSITDLYKFREEARAINKEHDKLVQLLEDRAPDAKQDLNEFLKDPINNYMLTQMPITTKKLEEINNLNRAINRVRTNPSLTGDQKTREMDRITNQRNLLARKFANTIRDVTAGLKETFYQEDIKVNQTPIAPVKNFDNMNSSYSTR